MTSPAYIALDLGTSFIKAALVYPAERRVAHISRRPFPEPLAGRPALWVEVDPAQVTAAVRSLLEELAPRAPECGGVVMCGQMAGLVLTGATGQALSPYISWRDQRLTLPAPGGGGTYYDRLTERLSADDRRQLGQEVRPGATPSYLFWLAQTGQLPAGEPYAATLLEFVLANLCGAPPVMEPTLAIGFLNLETGDWHHEVLAKLGLAGVRWPALGDFRTVVGQVRVDGRRLPCYAAVGDQQCALVGAGVAADELSLNISTGSQASRTTPTLALGPYQTRPFFDGRFMNTITHIPAGRALNVLLALATELSGPDARDPWPYLHQAAVAAGDTDLQVDLAFFPSPVGQRGTITNIHTDNLTLGHVFRAALRNMADNYQTCARRLAPAQDWQTLVFSGGLAHHLPLLRELILERLPGPARLSAVTEDTLTGLLALTQVLSGEAGTVAAAAESLREAPPVIE